MQWVLIANRGEIALRPIWVVRRLRLERVAAHPGCTPLVKSGAYASGWARQGGTR